MDRDTPLKWDTALEDGLANGKSVLELLTGVGEIIDCGPLKGAMGIAKQIVEAAQKVRTNKKDCAALVRKIYALMHTIVNAVGNRKDEEIDAKLKADLQKIYNMLETVNNKIVVIQLKGFLKQLWMRERVAGEIKELGTLISDTLGHFNTSTLIELRAVQAGIRADLIVIHDDVRDIAVTIQKQVEEPSRPRIPSFTFSSIPPPAPLHFFGRDDVVEKAVTVLVSSTPMHIAILGTGGIGKTSLALRVIHHSDVRSKFGSSRYSVSCESVFTAAMLVSGIIITLGASATAGDQLAMLNQALCSHSPLVLILDNFETPWMEEGQQTNIVDILTRIAACPDVWLIVTTRSGTPPARVELSWLPLPLDPLSLDSAKELFLTINPETTVHEYSDLTILLKHLDCLPLAVKLLAQQKRSQPCSRLRERWEMQKTALLNTQPNQAGRLTSLDVSISFSLNSPLMKAVPEAILLLSLLCKLADGIKGGVAQLEAMDLGFKDLDGALSAITDVALATCDSAIRVLSPIRLYILHHHEPTLNHLQRLYHYYTTLIQQYDSVHPFHQHFLEAKHNLGPELGNIVNILSEALKKNSEESLMTAALSFAKFQYWEMPALEIIDLLLGQQDIPKAMKAEIHRTKARLCMQLDQYPVAKVHFEEAKISFLQTDHAMAAADCLMSLGNIHYMQSQYTEAQEALESSRGQFLKVGSALGAAQSLQSLANIHRMQSRNTEAQEELESARGQFLQIGNALGATQCLQGLGDIQHMQSRYPEAQDALEEARRQFLKVGSVVEAAQCLQSLGNIHYMQSRYTEAQEELESARGQFLQIGNINGEAQCLRSLGNIHRVQSQYTEAQEALEEARGQFLKIGDVKGHTDCVDALGNLHREQGHYTEATVMLTSAMNEYTRIGSSLNVAYSLYYLGLTLEAQHNYQSALEHCEKAMAIFISLDMEHKIHMCSREIATLTGILATASQEEDTKAVLDSVEDTGLI